jgi:hypothetical protein
LVSWYRDTVEQRWKLWLTERHISERIGMPRRSDKLDRAIRDKSGAEISTRTQAKRYVLDRLRKKPNSRSWNRAAELLLEDAASDAIDKQLRFALLVDGALDLREPQ